MATNTEIQKIIVADEQIIDLYWERNEKAIQLTTDKYGRFLYCIAYNILHDRLDCEECQNDTYLGVWNTIPPNRPDVFSIFISRIMRNVACKKYKEKTRKKRVPSEMTFSMDELENSLYSDETPEKKILADELAKIINSYLNGLTDRQQYIFIGRYYMCDTLEIIAGELNVAPSTVYREIKKINQGLKSYLERIGVYVS